MTQPVTCSNCGWRGTEEECDDVKFLEGRVAAGEIVPAGECPVCGCLAHLDRVADPHALIAALRRAGKGGRMNARWFSLSYDTPSGRIALHNLQWDGAMSILHAQNHLGTNTFLLIRQARHYSDDEIQRLRIG